MRFDLDVAHLAVSAEGGYRVLRVVAMRRGRIGRPVLRCYGVLEAERGAFERWGVREGVSVATVSL
jgi:uncharacterized protein